MEYFTNKIDKLMVKLNLRKKKIYIGESLIIDYRMGGVATSELVSLSGQ